MKRAGLALALVAIALTVAADPAAADLVRAKATLKRPTPAARAAPQPHGDTPVVTAAATGPGQTGYVHYFVITGPDGEPETQVGLELPGDRIAWSFPELGVVISPFLASGTVEAAGRTYHVEHLYGIRPFGDERSMRSLQQALVTRVQLWVDAKIPYCDEEHAHAGLCVSCLGFVLRVLYPGPTPDFPAPPPDFKGARRNLYSTEDFILYLAGVRVDAPVRARMKRIEALAIPAGLRAELVRLAQKL